MPRFTWPAIAEWLAQPSSADFNRRVTPNLVVRTSSELDLTQQAAVTDFLASEKADYIFMAAAKVGGIHANNTYRADFILQEPDYRGEHHPCGRKGWRWPDVVSRLSCIYPRDCPQPDQGGLPSGPGPLELTNEPYAIAKIAGIKLCENYNRQYGTQYVSAMPTNLYGPNDNYDLSNSHVLPALIRKAHEAKQRGDRVYEVGGPANRCGNSSMLTTWLTLACSSWKTTPFATASLMWVREPM